MKQILFVCLGNICRSPLAEAIFNLKTKNMEMLADSAGTDAFHIGEQPDDRTIRVANEHNIPILHKARKFVIQDFERFDYIIAMDNQNLFKINSFQHHHPHIYLLREYDTLGIGEVPDPYYGGYDGFVEIYDMMSRCIDQLIEDIQKQER